MLGKLILYGVAAVIAIFMNIGSQYVVIQLFGDLPGAVLLSILVGTGVGLVAKYVMDKVLIFEVKFERSASELSQFIFYTFTGVFTTIVFWGVELAFQLIFQTDLMRYIGGVIGLVIGYVLKFLLDSKFVFKRKIGNSGIQPRDAEG